jgi:membrane associated rhomboid family serine protease
MLIPLRCDAPLYHGPWGTLGVIILCVLLHVTVGASDAVDAWLLIYGEWNPLQWLTSAVVHEGWIHLIGNMVFFWVFGLIVEGKIGWQRFLGLLAAIAVLSGCVEQTLMLGSDGASLGISGVIFGLIAIAWIWAPDNEVDVLLLLFPFIRHFDVRVRTLGLIYIALEVLSAMLNGFAMSTPVLHLLGAAAGLPLGIVMLKKGWVDCEGWDWFSRRSGSQAPPKPKAKHSPTTAAPEPLPDLDTLVRNEGTAAGFALWSRRSAEVPPATAFRLAARLVDEKRWEDAEAVASRLAAAPAPGNAVHLLYAWVLTQRNRPGTALDQLALLANPTPAEAGKAAHIRADAERRRAELPYELA